MATRSGQSRTRETSSFNLFHPYLELAGGGGVEGEAGTGQGTEDGGPGGLPSTSWICAHPPTAHPNRPSTLISLGTSGA